MYRLYVRRNPCEPWTAWTETYSITVLAQNIEVVERYGWQWSLEN